jgi:hypothetical protein
MNVRLSECGATKHMIIVGTFLQYSLQMTYIYLLFFEVGTSHTVKLVVSKCFTNKKYKYKFMHIKSNSKEE